MDSSQEKILIQLFNRDYKIRTGESDPDYIKKLSNMINSRYDEYEQQFPALSKDELIVLVCLNIADEALYLQEKQKNDQEGATTQELGEKLIHIRQLLRKEE